MKRLFFFIAAIFVAVTAFGQTQLPNDPETKVGKLDNGMTYYIRHNDKPAQRAEFYLATNVGAFQEADDQDGLAHFLEHMCFNGTKNFPDKSLLDWLQSIGAEFGRNINASTGFEQTQYMLNNIPIARESIIDSCLLIMHDYSHFVTCDPAEIDAERGVILEERRTRRDASWRMYEQSLPYLYGGTPYAKRTLIGGEEQLKTFKYESLTNFYHTWYRPDMQALVVVGDIDVDQVEAKIKSIFSDIPAPEAPTQKVIHKIPDNAEPIVAVLTDPEATSSNIEVIWKSEPMPLEFNSTDVGFMTDIIKSYVSLVMRERFGDISAKPDAPFLGASFGVGRLCLASDAAFGNVSFKDGDAVPAFKAYMTELEKMKRFGFTDGEVQRAKDNIISYYEKAAEAAATRKNADFIWPILNNFYFNESFMDPAQTLELAKMVCAQITAPILSQVTSSLITDENLIIIFKGPEKEGIANPTEEQLTAIIQEVKAAEIEANAEENLNEPLLDPAALKGSKVKNTATGDYGSTVWTLKNGVKVVVLPTQHKKDQVLYTLSLDGGKTLIATEDMPSFEDNIWALYLSNTGVSKFSGTDMTKMLAGKNVSVMPYLSNIQHGINGQCAPKDVETALQLMYLMFTEPRFDKDEYATGIQQINAVLPNIKNNPMFQFQNALNKTLYAGNERVVELNEETLAVANLETLERVYKNVLFKDAAGAVLYIVGNVDLEALKPMVEKYIGSLPKGKKAQSVIEENLISMAKGTVVNDVKVPMQTPKTTVFQVNIAYMPIDTKTEVTLEIANFILDMIYTKTIREQEGGTYGVGTSLSATRDPYSRITLMVQFDTNPEQGERLCGLTAKYLKEFAQNGPTPEEFAMALENVKKNLPESRIANYYWLNVLDENETYGIDYDAEYEAAINSVTAEDVKALLQKVLAEENFIQVLLSPAE